MGVDTLSAYGGFEYLNFSETDRYPSEIADGGYVKWQKIKQNPDGTVGPISYSNVRWDFNTKPFGWSSLQHSVYYKANITIPESGIYVASFNGVHTFKIDDEAFLGNIYNDDYLAPSIIYLEAGIHAIFVCTILDVRVTGGSTPPKPNFSGRIIPIQNSDAPENILLLPKEDILPEIMNDNFITSSASITFINGRIHESQNPPNFQANNHRHHIFHNFYSSGWVELSDIMAYSEKNTPVGFIVSQLFSF
jgi:hypothetical protein